MEEKKISILKYTTIIMIFIIIPLIVLSFLVYFLVSYFTKSSTISSEVTTVTTIPILLGGISAMRWYMEKNELISPFHKNIVVYNLDSNDNVEIPEELIRTYETRMLYFLENNLYNEYLKTLSFVVSFYLKNAVVNNDVRSFLKAKDLIKKGDCIIEEKKIKNNVIELFQLVRKRVEDYSKKFE